MNPPLFDLTYCPIVPALEVIGGKWKPLVVYHIYDGVQRFGGLQRSIPSISKTMLTQQLRELEADGVVHREMFREIPPKVEYSLTAFGSSLGPVMTALDEWGRGHHQRLKQFINGQARGVSTKHLPDYLGWSRAVRRPGFDPVLLLADTLIHRCV